MILRIIGIIFFIAGITIILGICLLSCEYSFSHNGAGFNLLYYGNAYIRINGGISYESNAR